jgi:hypothetical protein
VRPIGGIKTDICSINEDLSRVENAIKEASNVDFPGCRNFSATVLNPGEEGPTSVDSAFG